MTTTGDHTTVDMARANFIDSVREFWDYRREKCFSEGKRDDAALESKITKISLQSQSHMDKFYELGGDGKSLERAVKTAEYSYGEEYGIRISSICNTVPLRLVNN